MSDAADSASFDKSRAELFDALGHPVRIRILQALEAGPLGFSELRRKVGLESSGHLQFHLGKLDGLVMISASGTYSLTDDGREALRVVQRGGGGLSGGEEGRKFGVPLRRAMTVGLLILVVVVGSIAVFQQLEISNLNSSIARLLQGKEAEPCGVDNATTSFNADQQSSQTVTVTTYVNVTSSFGAGQQLSQVVSSTGLGLNVTVSSGSVRCGDMVYANASLFNTLDTNLTLAMNRTTLPSNGKWAYEIGYPCGSNLPVQLAVFAGYYDESNFSKAGNPLMLGDASVPIYCLEPSPLPAGLVFLPQSGTAYELSSYSSLNDTLASVSVTLQHWACSTENSQGERVCGYETGASGSYSGGGGPTNGFQLFQFGVYTIAALDDWGDVALVHFAVQ